MLSGNEFKLEPEPEPEPEYESDSESEYESECEFEPVSTISEIKLENIDIDSNNVPSPKSPTSLRHRNVSEIKRTNNKIKRKNNENNNDNYNDNGWDD